jgi:hypothetical protein
MMIKIVVPPSSSISTALGIFRSCVTAVKGPGTFAYGSVREPSGLQPGRVS